MNLIIWINDKILKNLFIDGNNKRSTRDTFQRDTLQWKTFAGTLQRFERPIHVR